MESRVGQLDLRIRAPANHAPGLIPATRDFAARVLERCDELLEQRAPGRLVFMRNLDMRWRLRETGVDAPGEIEAVALELADALDEAVCSGASLSERGGEMVVFADEAHYFAEYLQAVAERRAMSCWFFEPIAGETLSGLLGVGSERRALVEQVVTRLATKQAAERVLAALPPTLVNELSQAFDGTDEPSPARQLLTILRGRQIQLAGPSHLSEPADEQRAADVQDVAVFRPSRWEETNTQFGGAFYLLNPIAELSLGETLWRACLPEPAMFACIARAILGIDTTKDPAPRLLGASTPGADLTPIAVDQHSEVSMETLTALVRSLSARHPAWPGMRLLLVTHQTGRLLVATPEASAFVLFAWPAESADAVRKGLRTFLAQWPASAPAPIAQSALASIDGSGRIKSACTAGPPPLLTDLEDPLAAALVAQSAGTVAWVFGTRIGGIDLSGTADLVERHLRVPARVRLSADEMIVTMPMDRIDLAVRRAGLDRNPGWVPWLNRRVILEFDE